ncbi:TIGR02117 family protein [Consotaella aegiceratis]|uniref:TIGR02117 family protein n=1 Tax=Consotaella aegiceratis TaxID=3097961 RepID=UPI002F3FCB9D
MIPRAPTTGFHREMSAGLRTVYLLANPIHTDIAFTATPDVLSQFGFLTRDGLPLDHPGLRTIVVGWGGRTFYTRTPQWADLTVDTVLRSFTLDESVLHVTLAGPIADDAPDVTRLQLDEPAHAALLDFVAASFSETDDGQPNALPGAAYGATDGFYEASGRFNALWGCNTWTAAALRAAGFTTAFWTPLPQTLLLGLRLHNDR